MDRRIAAEAARVVVESFARSGIPALEELGKTWLAERAGDGDAAAPPGSAPGDPGDLAPYIDHTLLKPEATAEGIRALCGEAREHRFVAVCVNPVFVERAAGWLRGSEVKVASVIGFPLGAGTARALAFEAEDAIASGARELDMVLPIGALKEGDLERVRGQVAAASGAARRGGALLKVILETALLEDREKVAGALLARAAGADFVKTSTGFSGGGATLDDVALLRAVVGPHTGVKASGGIRTAADAWAMVRAGADRLGTSSGVRIVGEASGRVPG